MAELGIKVSWEFEAVQTDLSACAVCEEIIFSTMWQLIIKVIDEKVITETKICEACYDRDK